MPSVCASAAAPPSATPPIKASTAVVRERVIRNILRDAHHRCKMSPMQQIG
jgi:hypothetical protein